MLKNSGIDFGDVLSVDDGVVQIVNINHQQRLVHRQFQLLQHYIILGNRNTFSSSVDTQNTTLLKLNHFKFIKLATASLEVQQLLH